MKSAALLSRPASEIVNVASVPQRSPFRYPGGKTWLIPQVRKWLASLPSRPSEFIEPFAGGAIASLTVAAEDLADHVTLVELDEDVAAVWQAIINEGEGEWLAKRIVNFDLTADSVNEMLARTPKSIKERAFQTILRNRVFHGGILAPGSGLIKNGENGKGITSRWYPETLSERIMAIDYFRHKISFVHGDGLKVLRHQAVKNNRAFFIDPPYTAGGKQAGKRLYAHWQLDHEKLFELAGSLKGDFLMTYDDAPELHRLAERYKLETELVAMNNTHHAKMTELLIGPDLGWVRKSSDQNGMRNVWD